MCGNDRIIAALILCAACCACKSGGQGTSGDVVEEVSSHVHTSCQGVTPDDDGHPCKGDLYCTQDECCEYTGECDWAFDCTCNEGRFNCDINHWFLFSCEPPDADGGDGGTDVPDLRDASPDADVALPDLTPSEPVFERGDILPPDSLPCVNLDTGEETFHCNHHGSSVAVTADGTVLAVWYHGLGEKSKDSRIVWSRRPHGGDFGPVEVLYDNPGLAEGNPAIWIREDGTFYLFFVTIFGESWNDAKILLIRSTDGGKSWTGPQVIREEWGWMVRNHPVRMSNGELLLPAYSEILYAPAFLISTDDFVKEWLQVSPDDDAEFLINHLGQIQPAVVERTDHTLFAINRDTNASHKMAFEMTSADFGRTWTPGVQSQIPNDNTGIDMTRLASGRLVLAFNNTTSGRYPLSAALSEDDGLTWNAIADLDGPCEDPGGCSHGYTSVAQDPTDLSIWITFTDERATIGWVHLNEPWLLQQKGAFVLPQNAD